MRIASGVTDQYIYFVAKEPYSGVRLTGLGTFTVYRSRNGGAAAAYTTPTINETDATNMPGVYELLLDEDMTIDSGDETQEVVLHITQASMEPVTRVFELYRPKITAGETLTVASSVLPWNAAWDAEVQSEVADALAVYDPPTNAEMEARTLVAANYATATALQTVDDEIATIDGIVDSILVDTAEIGAAGAGLTALATAANLATVAGYLDTEIAAILADTNELQTDWANGGRLDLLIDAIEAKTDSLTFTVAGQVDANIKSVTGVTITGVGSEADPWGP